MARRKLLNPDERQALLGIPDDEESLIRHYTLSPQDRLQAEVRRRPHNQLGYAVQLCIMRYPGRVLGMDEDPPAAVVTYVAEQLGITPDVFHPMRVAFRHALSTVTAWRSTWAFGLQRGTIVARPCWPPPRLRARPKAVCRL